MRNIAQLSFSRILAAFLCLLLLTACGGGSAPINMSGYWSLTLTNRGNGNTTSVWTLDLYHGGSAISGTAYITGEPVGSVSGTANGAKASFRLNVYSDYGGGYFDFEITVSNDAFTGEYKASGGGYGPVSGNRMFSSAFPDALQSIPSGNTSLLRTSIDAMLAQ